MSHTGQCRSVRLNRSIGYRSSLVAPVGKQDEPIKRLVKLSQHYRVCCWRISLTFWIEGNVLRWMIHPAWERIVLPKAGRAFAPYERDAVASTRAATGAAGAIVAHSAMETTLSYGDAFPGRQAYAVPWLEGRLPASKVLNSSAEWEPQQTELLGAPMS